MSSIHLGILLCAYNSEKYLPHCLAPWQEAAKNHKISIAAVHSQFKEYAEMGYPDNDKPTLDLLKVARLDYLYVANNYDAPESKIPLYEEEHKVRNNGLEYLIANGADYVMLVDADEIYTLEEIDNLIKYIESNKLIHYFKIEFKNVIEIGGQVGYIKGFNPNRVFRVKNKEKRILDGLVYDNDVSFQGKPQNLFSSKSIPTSILSPLHMTWLNNDISKGKVQYHEARWSYNKGLGFGCSYKINKEGNLDFNDEYYSRTNHIKPHIWDLEEKDKMLLTTLKG